MFGAAAAFAGQEALPASEVQELVSSLPPINTVFMGGGQ